MTAVDTASNYLGFGSHAKLAEVGGDLLPRFMISTKVGYFPASDGRVRHSLVPEDLRAAVAGANRELGRTPEVVFLHNPEASLVAGEQGKEQLAAACGVLAEAATAGWCGAWGISSWNPRVLAALGSSLPLAPDVLMVRSGLLVGHQVMAAGEILARQWGVPRERRWGMSPFGGDLTDPPWRRSDSRLFLADHADAHATQVQAAFRVAFELPLVGAVAVGTDEPDHLRELVAATGLTVRGELIDRYRRLLSEKAAVTPSAAG
ncbi:aldo/keto reductase [Kitasatospora sp. NPDC001664]